MKNLTATVFVHRMSKYIYCKRVSIVYVQSGLVQPSINYFFLNTFYPKLIYHLFSPIQRKSFIKNYIEYKTSGKKTIFKGLGEKSFKKNMQP